MKHLRRVFFWIPIMMIVFMIAYAGSVSAAEAEYEFLSKTDSISVVSTDVYNVIDGVREAEIVLRKSTGSQVTAHVLLVKPYAKASFKPVVPGYYTKNSTKESRTETAKQWTNASWKTSGISNMIKEYESAADTSSQPVIAAINGDFSNSSGTAPRGSVILEGNELAHSSAVNDEFFFGHKKSGAVNIVQRITGQKPLFDEAICGNAYIVRNGSTNGLENETDSRQRTGIAFRTNGDILLITVENPGISIKELAELMKASGCWNGINMDGGGSIYFTTKRTDDTVLTKRTPAPGSGYTCDENGERIVTSALMLVKDETAVANNIPDVEEGSKIDTDKTIYKQGEDIKVTASTNVDGAWVSLVKKDDPVNALSYFWYYIYGASDEATMCWDNGGTYNIFEDGMCNGRDKVTSADDLIPGNYKVSIMTYADSGNSYEELAAKEFTVEGDSDATYSLSTDKKQYNVGEPIMTTITAPYTDSKAWVGILKHGETASASHPVYYWYYNFSGHKNGEAYNILEQTEIIDEVWNILDAENQAMIDRNNNTLLAGTYDINVYMDDGYTIATGQDGKPLSRTISIVDPNAEYSITYKDGSKNINNLEPTSYTFSTAQASAIKLPSVVEKSGYEFIGWYDNAEFTGEAVTDISKGSSGNKIFYAKFKKNSYNVIFDTDGGSEVDNQRVSYEDKAVKPEKDPEKDGYIFIGWVTKKDGTSVYDFDSAITEDTTIYAKWQIKPETSYTVNFDSDGGNKVISQYIKAGETATKPDDPVKKGYIFDKWVTEPNGIIEFNFDNKITENITVYAIWKVEKYTITFDSNGGNEVQQIEYTIESDKFKLPETTKDGYIFIGWKDSLENTYEEIANGSTGNLSLTAQWQRDNYLSTDKDNYIEGEPIKVTAYSNMSNAWVGLYKESDAPGTGEFAYYWTYISKLNGKEFNLIDAQYKHKDNNKTFEPGEYKVILFYEEGKEYYNILLNRNITISEDKDPAKGTLKVSGASREDKTYSGKVSEYNGKKMYEFFYGDGIFATASLSGNSIDNAWIGIVSDDSYNNGDVNIDSTVKKHWYYVKDFKDKSVNLNYIVSNQISEETSGISRGLNYWIVLVSDSGKILDGVPFNYRTFNMDWFENGDAWGELASEKIKVETDWTTTKANGCNQIPTVTIKRVGGHFGYKKGENNEYIEITEETLKKDKDYTLVYPEESKDTGIYNIQIVFPESNDTDKFNYLSTKPQYYGLKDGIVYYITSDSDEHIIKYVMNGGYNDSDNPYIYKTGTKTELKSATKQGYIFDGWYTTSDFKPGTQLDRIDRDETRDLILYARWSLESDAPYTIKYVLNGGDNDINNPSKYTGEANLSIKPASKVGYTFDGWYYDEAFTISADVIKKGTHQKLTLYAKFDKIENESFNITTEVTGGAITETVFAEYGDSVTVEYEANKGYVIRSISVDGEAVAINKFKDSYTFDNVDSHHHIAVVFVKFNLDAPEKVTAQLNTASGGYDDVKLKWSEVNGADGYIVYYKKSTSKTYTLLTKTDKTSVTKANLSDGVKYYFKVVPYINCGEEIYASSKYKTVNIYTLKRVAAPKISKSGSKVKIKWTNINGETGYQISKATKKNGTNIVSTYKTTTGTYKALKVKKGTKYYYKVRAYKVVNGKKVYAPWSYIKPFKR